MDDEDFERVSAHKWCADVSNKTVYARNTKSKQRLHRFILGITDPSVKVDHEDHNGLNCQHYNLRDSQGKNNQNQQKKSNNTSGFKGVSWHKEKKKWVVRIKVDKHYLFMGYFYCPLEAACAYDMAAVKHFGEFAHCNFAIPN